MKPILFLIVLFGSPVLSQFFEEIQVLMEPSNYTYSIDMTNDSRILVAGFTDNKTYIYMKNSSTYMHTQTLTDSESYVVVTDISDDGEYLVVVDLYVKIRIYKNINDTFQINQQLNPSDVPQQIWVGILSDDHEWMIHGTYNESQIHIFFFNGMQFLINQTIETSEPVQAVAMTQDHQFLAVGTTGPVQLYKHNGTHFNPLQTLNFSQSPKQVSITDDHEILTVTPHKVGSPIFTEKFNEQEEIFEKVGNQAFFQFLNIDISTVSPNKKWMCLSTNENTYIYTDLEENLTKVQTLPKSNYHKFSKDGKYLYTSWIGELRVYEMICNSSGGLFYNSTSDQCELCTLYHNYYINEWEECVYCNPLERFFLDNGECLYCNESEGYSMVGDQCFYCGVQGCINCIDGTCTKCYESLDFFMINGTCQRCPITGCTDCLSNSQCLECDEQGNYFLNNGTCVQCIIEGCIKCSDQNTCSVCDSSLDYFSVGNNACQKCNIQNCLDCLDLSSCSSCDESKNYFLTQSAICSLCSVTGCLDCLTLSTCQGCDQGKDYFLNSGLCQLCSIQGCLNCQNLNTCEVCDSQKGYLLNNGNCSICRVEGCLNCENLYTCLQCHESKDYFSEGDGTCELCSIPGCLDCKNKNTCQKCDESKYSLSESGQCVVANSSQFLGLLIPLVVFAIIAIILTVCLGLMKERPAEVENQYQPQQERRRQKHFETTEGRVDTIMNFENTMRAEEI